VELTALPQTFYLGLRGIVLRGRRGGKGKGKQMGEGVDIAWSSL